MLSSITAYFREALSELKKVIWPSRRETVKHTLLVIVISLVVAAFLGALDYLLNEVLEKII